MSTDILLEMILSDDTVTIDDSYTLKADAADTTVEWDVADTTIVFESITCEPYQFLTIRNKEMVCVELPTEAWVKYSHSTIIQEVPMNWTIGNIAVVVIICIIVYKLMPKLTLANFFRAVWKFIIRPFRRKERDIANDWKQAERETDER